MISATGRLSLIAPPPARLIIIDLSVVRRLRRRSSAGRRILPAQIGTRAMKRAMLAIEVHRHPAVSAILDGRGIDGGLDLVAADRAPPAERDWAVYSWVMSERWMPP
jgi:hypothetical protein